MQGGAGELLAICSRLVNIWPLWLAEPPCLAKEHQDQGGNSLWWTQITSIYRPALLPQCNIECSPCQVMLWCHKDIYRRRTACFTCSDDLLTLFRRQSWTKMCIGVSEAKKRTEGQDNPLTIHRCLKCWILEKNKRENYWVLGTLDIWSHLLLTSTPWSNRIITPLLQKGQRPRQVKWLILYVNFTGSQGIYIFGQTFFWVFL